MCNKEMETPYYIFDADAFIENFKDLESAFVSIYSKYKIGYSFKTNYTPAVCETVKELRGYAEVVSDMEYALAKKVGFLDEQIIYNGPVKGRFLDTCLLGHGMLNIDHLSELDRVCEFAKNHSDTTFEIGLRVNFDINNGLHSRFGIDVTNGDIERAIKMVDDVSNVRIIGLHFHISRARGVDAWKKRINTLLDVAERYFNGKLKYIDIGSGMFGKLDYSLKKQFGEIPSYKEYANVVARAMQEKYNEKLDDEKPLLITEPGTTVVSKYFSLKASVQDIKTIRGKTFALLNCSFHNIGEICQMKKLPIKITFMGGETKYYKSLSFVGYTCLEQDIMYEGYNGHLAKGDIIEFGNVGGYSIVEKPPFIYPDIPVYMKHRGSIQIIKRAQTFDDIFAPYCFNCVEKI